MELVLKTSDAATRRGFESHSLRHTEKRHGYKIRGVFCNFFVKPLTKADCLPGHFPGEGRFSPNFAKKKKGVDKFLLLW